jgi:hypothetical protein
MPKGVFQMIAQQESQKSAIKISQVLNLLSAAGIFLFGIASTIAPKFIADATHMALLDPRGSAEYRIGFGGIFMGIGLIALLRRERPMFKLLAAAWAGAALVRLLSIFLDQPALTVDYFVFLAVEISFAIFSNVE